MKTIYKSSFSPTSIFRINYPWIVKALVILAILINFCLLVSATTYNLTTTGKWTAPEIWSPQYPGNVIQIDDTVVIENVVTLNTPLTINGTLIVKEDASIIGNKEIIITQGGSWLNYGNSVARSIVNYGTMINQNVLESSEGITNNGTIMNNESLVIGTDFINDGTLYGTNGMVMSNNQIQNTADGIIQGSIDLCATSSITNLGSMDSSKLSICGVPMQQNIVDWKVNMDGQYVEIKLQDPKNLSYSYISIEKSTDGNSFIEIKAVSRDDFSKFDRSYAYMDDSPTTESVYYRIKVVDKYGIVSYAPKVEFKYEQTASAQR